MPSRWDWFDDSRTIAIVSLEGEWSKQDLIDHTIYFWPQLEQQSHTVDIIVDLRGAQRLPSQPITTLIWMAKHRPANAGRVVFVVRRPVGLALARALNQTMARLFPRFHILGTLTPEDAVRLLTASVGKVDSRSSSAVEAGNQLPSVFPR